jgi:hypothetical protein
MLTEISHVTNTDSITVTAPSNCIAMMPKKYHTTKKADENGSNHATTCLPR